MWVCLQVALLCALAVLRGCSAGYAPLHAPLTLVRHAPPAVPPYSTQVNIFRWLAAFPPPVLHRALLLAHGHKLPALHHHLLHHSPPLHHHLLVHHSPPLHHAPLPPPVLHHTPVAHAPPVLHHTPLVPAQGPAVFPPPAPPLVPPLGPTVKSPPVPALNGLPHGLLPHGLNPAFNFLPDGLPFSPGLLPNPSLLPTSGFLPTRGFLPAAEPTPVTPTLRPDNPTPLPPVAASPTPFNPFSPFTPSFTPNSFLPAPTPTSFTPSLFPGGFNPGPTLSPYPFSPGSLGFDLNSLYFPTPTQAPFSPPQTFPPPPESHPTAAPNNPAGLTYQDSHPVALPLRQFRPVPFRQFLPATNGITRATAGNLSL